MKRSTGRKSRISAHYTEVILLAKLPNVKHNCTKSALRLHKFPKFFPKVSFLLHRGPGASSKGRRDPAGRGNGNFFNKFHIPRKNYTKIKNSGSNPFVFTRKYGMILKRAPFFLWSCDHLSELFDCNILHNRFVFIVLLNILSVKFHFHRFLIQIWFLMCQKIRFLNNPSIDAVPKIWYPIAMNQTN